MHGLSSSAQHLSVSPSCINNANNLNYYNCSASVRGTVLRRRSCPTMLAPLSSARRTAATQLHPRCYSSALFMAGGGAGDGPPAYTTGISSSGSSSRSSSSSSSIGCDGVVAVDAPSPRMRSGDVPNTVIYNGEVWLHVRSWIYNSRRHNTLHELLKKLL